MKKLTNFLWPFRKEFKSVQNNFLEVTWQKNKEVLNTKNANYSYGALERIMDFGLSRAYADRSSEILVLGLGGGCVLKLLRKKFNYQGKITAVEIDPVVIRIAVEEFKIKQYEPLELIISDAFEFVGQTNSSYGLIIVDVFIDLDVPLQFYSIKFWEHIARILKKDGTVIFNAGVLTANEKEINLVLPKIKTLLHFKKFENVYGTNTILLGTRIE